MLPLTFDEVASLLVTWPRVGERPRFMSWHDSNTIIRSWHGASLSDGERAERRVGAGGMRAGWRLRRHSMTDGHITCTQAGKHRGMHTHMELSTNTYNHASKHTHTHTPWATKRKELSHCTPTVCLLFHWLIALITGPANACLSVTVGDVVSSWVNCSNSCPTSSIFDVIQKS